MSQRPLTQSDALMITNQIIYTGGGYRSVRFILGWFSEVYDLPPIEIVRALRIYRDQMKAEKAAL